MAVEETIMEMFDDGDLLTKIQEEFSPNEIFEFEHIQEYVLENYNIDDVWEEEEINEWWHDHNEVMDLIDYDMIVDIACHNYTPDELYGAEYMMDWSEDQWGDSIREQMLEWIKDEQDPEDIFEVEVLEEWARKHGMIMPEDCPEPEPSPQPGHIE
jgi:hypothetical protein